MCILIMLHNINPGKSKMMHEMSEMMDSLTSISKAEDNARTELKRTHISWLLRHIYFYD